MLSEPAESPDVPVLKRSVQRIEGMIQFCKDLLTEWRKLGMPFYDETFIVAVSGGADSVSLALALQDLRERRKLELRFVIAHFNHRLRGKESDEDEKYVKSIAGKYGFELALGSWTASRDGNLEQSARRSRYEFLTKTAANLQAFGIVTAHTMNDQAETFLMNLIRGSGLEGLGGMKTLRSMGTEEQIRITNYEMRQNVDEPAQSKIVLVRPMLRWATREMTEAYCRERTAEYRYDTMNEDLAFQRVRVRKVLLPLLEDLNPKITQNLAKTAFLLQDDLIALEAVSVPAKAKMQKPGGQRCAELPVKELLKLIPAVRRMVIRDWIRARRGHLRQLETKHFEAIDNLIFSRKSGTIAELPNREMVSKRKGMIVYMKNEG